MNSALARRLDHDVAFLKRQRHRLFTDNMFALSGCADDVPGMAFVRSRNPDRVDRMAGAEFFDLVEGWHISMFLTEGIQRTCPYVGDCAEFYLRKLGEAGQDRLAGIAKSSNADFQRIHESILHIFRLEQRKKWCEEGDLTPHAISGTSPSN